MAEYSGYKKAYYAYCMRCLYICRSSQEEQLRAKVPRYQDPSADLPLAPGKYVDYGDDVAKNSRYVCTLQKFLTSPCVQ